MNYAKALYKVEYKILPSKKTKLLNLELNANPYLGKIFYTTDGSEPTTKSIKYTNALELQKDVTVKSVLFKNNVLKGKITTREYAINKATNKTITFKTEPSKYYNHGGGFTLVDGAVAKLPRVNDEWLGWSGNDLETIIDLESQTTITHIQIGFLNEELNWIYLPKNVEFYISNDGIKYTSIGSSPIKDNRFSILETKPLKTKYVKIINNASKL